MNSEKIIIDEDKPKSLLRISFLIIYSSCIGSFIATFICFFPLGVFMAPFAMLLGPFLYALPLLPIAFICCVILDRKKIASKRNIILCGTIFSFLYGLLFISYLNYSIIFLLAFSLGGFFSSWVYWREMYLNLKGFGLF